EVGGALIVDDDVSVTAAGRRSRANAERADDVELIAVVGRPLHPRHLCARAERTRDPLVALRVDEVDRLALRAVAVDDGRWSKCDAARVAGRQNPAAVVRDERRGARELGRDDAE